MTLPHCHSLPFKVTRSPWFSVFSTARKDLHLHVAVPSSQVSEEATKALEQAQKRIDDLHAKKLNEATDRETDEKPSRWF